MGCTLAAAVENRIVCTEIVTVIPGGDRETPRRSVNQRIDVIHHGLGEGIGAEAGDEQLGRAVLVQILERVADMRAVGDHHAQIIADCILRAMPAGLIGGAVGAQYALVGSDVIRHENIGDGAESDAAGAFEAGLEAPAVQREGNIAQGERVVGFGLQRETGMERQRLRQGIDEAVGADRLPGELRGVDCVRDKPGGSADGKRLVGGVLGDRRCRPTVACRDRRRCRRGRGDRR